TFFLVSSVLITVVIIMTRLDWSITEGVVNLIESGFFKMTFFEDFRSPLFFPKQFFGGMFIAIAMTGLDQDLMQKNLTCKSINDAQKNMWSFTAIMVVVTFLFIVLGGLMYSYAEVIV